MSEPFSRILRIDTLPRGGETVELEANSSEREALARALKLPSIEALTASLTVRRTAGGARVAGRVHGELTQTCVVSLDAFPATVDEDVDVRFAPRDDEGKPRPEAEPLTVSMGEDDEPDPLIDGKIDLGALAAEFFALGLDPYPRKPGVSFEAPHDDVDDSPLADLGRRFPKRSD